MDSVMLPVVGEMLSSFLEQAISSQSPAKMSVMFDFIPLN
jgi:hypothetical protein